jgi:TRAP transporter TAXI family solute receptor
MKKIKWHTKIAPVLLIILVASTIFMCSVVKISAGTEPMEWKWPPSLKIGTVEMGGSAYIVTTAWIPVLEQTTGMKVRIIPSANEAMSARWLQKGDLDIQQSACSNVAEYLISGKDSYATRDGGPFQLRFVYLVKNSYGGYIVRRDSDIKTIYDLKPGMRFAVFKAVPAAVNQIHALLAWVNLKPDDVKLIPFGSFSANIKSVVEGKSDVALAYSTAPATYQSEASPHGIRWLELSPEDNNGYKRALSHRFTMVLGELEGGVKSSIGTKGFISPFGAYTLADTNPDLIYQLVKWQNDNFDAYKDKHEMCKQMKIDTLKKVLDNMPIPAHEGLIRYLKEKGMWTADNESWQKYNVDLLTKYEKAYNEAVARADKRKIQVNPGNKMWIELWENYKKELKLPPIKMRVMAQELGYK